MAIHLLTDLDCKNASVEPGKKIKKLADGGGLYLWVATDGSKRWRYRYFTEGTNRKGEAATVEKVVSLGAYPKVTLKAARAAAAKLREQADPAAERKAAKAAKAVGDTFGEVAREWLGLQLQWGEKYRRDMQARLERYAFPVIGRKPMRSIKARDLIEVQRGAKTEGASATALRLKPVLARIFRYAKTLELCDHNPVGDYDEDTMLPDLKPLVKATKRHQPGVKQSELPEMVKAVWLYAESGQRTALALKLAVLLFARANEMLRGTWEEIDEAGALWRIPGSRMKNGLPFLIPLAPQAVEILRQLKVLACGSPMVFPGHTGEKPLTSKALLDAWRRLGLGGVQTTHGLRRVASTALNEAAEDGRPLFRADAIERQLSHVHGVDKDGIRTTYNEADYLPERRRMMAWWANHLDETSRQK